VELIVEPRAGRAVIFTSGPENNHRVERVTKGERFVLSFWFTCDPQKQFEIFLDGKAHKTFSHKIKKSLLERSKVRS
jgi:predicted 2-oxoglutarate/Fe(II)-dependent dioxygenase YbiX